MKILRKDYQEKFQEKRDLIYAQREAELKEAWAEYFEIKGKIAILEQEFFEKLEKVKVSFYIGCRAYYQEVVKIGKAYFQYGRAMTRGAGYECIVEIPEIDDEMKKEMMEDSYYY